MEDRLEAKVTIALLTYNHEKFIRQAIDGILIQTYTNYEILISDDCSTDRTMDIIKEYQENYPGKFKVMHNEENIGAARNFRKLLQNCDGDYIALLDGDDFWIHPEKIKLQVEFLDSNKEYSSTFHRARVMKMDKKASFGNFIPPMHSTQSEFTMEDVMNDLFMPTASVVFRNQNSNLIPEWFEELFVCDKPLHLINLMHGKVKYIDLCMCVYRVHHSGIWSTKRNNKRKEFDKNKIIMLNHFNKYSNYQYNEMVESAINKCELRIYINCIKDLENNPNMHYKDIYFNNTKVKLENFFLNKEVYIFGTGEAGVNSYKLLTYSTTMVKAFIDNDIIKQGKELFNLPIISPNDFILNESVYIVVGSMYFNEIKEQLIGMGLQEDKQFALYTELLIAIDNLKDKVE